MGDKYDVFWKAYIRDWKSDNWREFKESKIWNTRLFTWREYDSEIGLYYYRARYYSSELGRFISRDPIGQIDDINLYSYVGNNSVMFVDPSGLEKTMTREERFWDLHNYIIWNNDYLNAMKSWDYINAIDLLFLEAKKVSWDNAELTLRTFADVTVFSSPFPSFEPIDAYETTMQDRKNQIFGLTKELEWFDKVQHFAFNALWSFVNQKLNDEKLFYSDTAVDIFLWGASYWFEYFWIPFWQVYDEWDIKANEYGVIFWEAFYNNIRV